MSRQVARLHFTGRLRGHEPGGGVESRAVAGPSCHRTANRSLIALPPLEVLVEVWGEVARLLKGAMHRRLTDFQEALNAALSRGLAVWAAPTAPKRQQPCLLATDVAVDWPAADQFEWLAGRIRPARRGSIDSKPICSTGDPGRNPNSPEVQSSKSGSTVKVSPGGAFVTPCRE